MLETILKIGNVLVPWATLIGLIVHCLRDKREFRKIRSPKQDER